jgi:hypothetical protein
MRHCSAALRTIKKFLQEEPHSAHSTRRAASLRYGGSRESGPEASIRAAKTLRHAMPGASFFLKDSHAVVSLPPVRLDGQIRRPRRAGRFRLSLRHRTGAGRSFAGAGPVQFLGGRLQRRSEIQRLGGHALRLAADGRHQARPRDHAAHHRRPAAGRQPGHFVRLLPVQARLRRPVRQQHVARPLRHAERHRQRELQHQARLRQALVQVVARLGQHGVRPGCRRGLLPRDAGRQRARLGERPGRHAEPEFERQRHRPVARDRRAPRDHARPAPVRRRLGRVEEQRPLPRQHLQRIGRRRVVPGEERGRGGLLWRDQHRPHARQQIPPTRGSRCGCKALRPS